MGTLSKLTDWIKSNPLIVLVGALTPLVGFALSVSNSMPTILRALNRPPCYTYGDTYQDSYTEFRRQGALWNEYSLATQQKIYEFREIHRDPDFILILNLTDRTNAVPKIPEWKDMVVRLAVCSPGKAEVLYGPGRPWEYLFDIWRP